MLASPQANRVQRTTPQSHTPTNKTPKCVPTKRRNNPAGAGGRGGAGPFACSCSVPASQFAWFHPRSTPCLCTTAPILATQLSYSYPISDVTGYISLDLVDAHKSRSPTSRRRRRSHSAPSVLLLHVFSLASQGSSDVQAKGCDRILQPVCLAALRMHAFVSLCCHRRQSLMHTKSLRAPAGMAMSALWRRRRRKASKRLGATSRYVSECPIDSNPRGKHSTFSG